jgi:hypothetical protein
MKTIFRSVQTVAGQALEPLMKRRLLAHSLQWVLTVALYAAGLWAVHAVSGDSRVGVVLFAVYFLPAVLRAWLLVYWGLRDTMKGVAGPRNRARKAL